MESVNERILGAHWHSFAKKAAALTRKTRPPLWRPDKLEAQLWLEWAAG